MPMHVFRLLSRPSRARWSPSALTGRWAPIEIEQGPQPCGRCLTGQRGTHRLPVETGGLRYCITSAALRFSPMLRAHGTPKATATSSPCCRARARPASSRAKLKVEAAKSKDPVRQQFTAGAASGSFQVRCAGSLCACSGMTGRPLAGLACRGLSAADRSADARDDGSAAERRPPRHSTIRTAVTDSQMSSLNRRAPRRTR